MLPIFSFELSFAFQTLMDSFSFHENVFLLCIIHILQSM